MYDRFSWTDASEKRNHILRQYEPLQPYILSAMAAFIESSVFIDVGANIGAYSLFMSLVPTITRIYAFEPSQQTYQELVKNVKANGLAERVMTSDLAISSSEQTVDFGIVDAHSGANSVLSTTIHTGKTFAAVYPVKCAPLDTVLDMSNSKACVKVDVEGHESEVISGASRFLSENVVIIQMEDYGASSNSSTEAMYRLGYRKILTIGPDLYFTNENTLFDSTLVLSLVEAAAGRLIASNLEAAAKASDLAKLQIAPGFAIEVSGSLRRALRRAKNLVRKRA